MQRKKAVIIGSGLGGLISGAILALEGFEVHVLEKNKQLGGNLQIFSRDKCVFDTGVHYVGGLAKGENLFQFFSYVGIMDKLKVKQLEPNHFDLIHFDGNPDVEYPMAQGYDLFVENLAKIFPEERENLTRYISEIRKVCEDFPLYNLKPGSQEIDSIYARVSLKEFIEGITSNKKLQNILIGNNLLYAGDAEKTPLHLHALVTNSYIQSSWRFVGGGSQIAIALSRVIISHGGKLQKHATVTKFETNEDSISEVILNTGERISGDLFISNIHPNATFSMLTHKSIRPAFRARLKSMENSVSTFMLNLVMEEASFPYFNYNYYIHKIDNLWDNLHHTEENWPKGYAIFCSESQKHPGYCEAISLMCYMRHDEVAQWTETFNTVASPSQRGEEYEAFKERKAEILISLLEKRFPNVRSKIKAKYTATPLSYRDYMGTEDGSIYGIVKDYRDPLRTFISPKTKINNLFLTGQNIHMHGVLGVTVGAILTCGQILGQEYLTNKILAQKY
jgi:all-trans-retinol 13,14-reductase